MIRFLMVLLFLGIGVAGVLILAGVLKSDSLAERLWTGIIYTLMGVVAVGAAVGGTGSGKPPSGRRTGATARESAVEVEDAGTDGE